MKRLHAAILAVFVNLHWGSGAAFGSTVSTLQQIIKNTVIPQIQSIGELLTILSYVLGVCLAAAGVLQFKAHKENPTQTPISKPITLLCVAGGLLFLPTVIEVAGQSLFAGGIRSNVSNALMKVAN